MKSIKPGRGPSKQSFIGSIYVVVFGVFWTVFAAVMTADAGIIGIIFPLFGLCFIGMGIHRAYVAYHNAHGKNRMSLYDIVDSAEEPDPWSPDYEQRRQQEKIDSSSNEAKFCPYCGKPIESDYKFCKYCGRSLI